MQVVYVLLAAQLASAGSASAQPEETGEILRSRALREKFAELDVELSPSTPEELAERVRSEIPVFTKAMRDAGIEPE
jgi:hypothetical protein